MSEAAATCDVLVVGGGINGAGIARDAAGRGLRTVLCEQHDLAAHTSSSSTKLIHGGLRYLEFYDFGLVRKSLRERETVLTSAPPIAWPLRFVLPHDAHLRPAWMLRAGVFLYDHLARRRRLPGSAAVDLQTHPAGAALDPRFTRGIPSPDLLRVGAEAYPHTKVSQFTTALDVTQIAFYGVMKQFYGPGGSCPNPVADWNQQMLGTLDSYATEINNFRFYLAGGTYHAIMRSPLFYSEASAGIPFSEWVGAMLKSQGGTGGSGGGKWRDTACGT